MNKIDNYVNEVLLHIQADREVKHRIREDLIASLNERMAYASSGEADYIISSLGSPAEMAMEYMNNLDIAVPAFINTRYEDSPYFEYRSKAALFGIPWIHVKTRRRFGHRFGVARGIIAIGDVSIGCISFGGVALGGISMGGVSAGLCSFGGLAIAALLAAGGIAIGTAALGGIAIGLFALGGIAVGQAAIGGLAMGKVTYEIRETNSVSWQVIQELVNRALK